MITRVCLIFWVLPLTLYTTWFVLSANDINFGSIYLSRQMHDLIMQSYANLLGIEASLVPALLIRAVVWDLAVVLCILAFRRRKQIRAWWNAHLHGKQPSTAPLNETAGESLTLSQHGDPVQRPL
ncbi:DUF6105 family protein [Notoacmeibacter sp. MSK16QG-6]|uniref:DUF6105 family protein n=1 Tax=Notoacmeibacter sp. MSK16QG-6 TaxID=2957982 RepID=UPI0020A1D7E6|nr:DUF6105 family protein [Notoacmeibacter sp. MSK16QG-6]